MKISIILPTFNEEGNISRLIIEILKYIKNPEIIVVDDNSTDNTTREVKNLNSKCVRLIVRKQERGLATAIKTGIEHATGDLIILMDTDFNHPPKDIPRLIKESKNFDMVIGSRFIKGGGMQNAKLRYFGSAVFNLFSKTLLRLPVSDTESGFLAINKSIFNKLNPNKVFFGYGDYCIRLLYFANKKNIKIKEIPVIYQKRIYGKSKTKFIRYFLQYSKSVIDIFLNKT